MGGGAAGKPVAVYTLLVECFQETVGVEHVGRGPGEVVSVIHVLESVDGFVP